MANATAKGPATCTPYETTNIKRVIATGAATYYPGTMLALNSSGYAVKCDDTAGIKFDGIMVDSYRVTLDSDDSQTDSNPKKATVQKPMFFTMTIASASAGDEGKAVYALYDNEVAYAAGVTNLIHVGWVEQVISSTSVLIRPVWAGTNIGANTMTFSGGTGTNIISLTDNLADALNFKEGANSYLKFTTTNGSEAVVIGKDVTSSGHITIADAKNIVVNATTGTKIGTAASQKLGFYNATPVVQRTKAAHNNWAAYTDVVNALVELGLFDTA